MKPTVAIGCPVRNRAWILPEYLAALDAIDHNPKRFLFVPNDCTDDTERVLWDWANGGDRSFTWRFVEYGGAMATHNEIYIANHDTPGAPGHRRNEYNSDGYTHLAAVRNHFIEMFLSETDATYLLSVDSDVIVPPDVLQRLLPLSDSRTIIGAALSNIVGAPLDGHTPGNWKIERGGVWMHPPEYPLTGVHEVAMTGACALYPRALFQAGVRFGPNANGEDEFLALAARERGFRFLVNMDCRPEHRMVATA